MEIQNSRGIICMDAHIYLCVCVHMCAYTFYETEMIPVAEAWGDDLVWQECQNHWIHPFQKPAEREAKSYFKLKETVTATIRKMCFNS